MYAEILRFLFNGGKKKINCPCKVLQVVSSHKTKSNIKGLSFSFSEQRGNKELFKVTEANFSRTRVTI